MKNIFSMIVAGMIGGLIVFGLGNSSAVQKELNQSPSATFASLNKISAKSPFDFIQASEAATPAVVHIFAQESKALAQQRYDSQRQKYRSPFEDFFGGDFFRGQNFYGPKQGSGSGVIVTSDGYIVTNNHVVEFADNIKVTLEDGREVLATKIGTDPSTDLAVIKINTDEKLATMPYMDSDKIRVGEWVVAVGNPFSYLTSTVTAGIVSAKGRDLDLIDGAKSIEEFIQTDAVVNPGNSGGALVTSDGKLAGINTAIATPTGVYAGYSFAIPSNLVQKIVKDIIANGDIERGSLGISGYEVADVKEELGLDVDNGFYVDYVERRSAAQFAGLIPGDVILSINNIEVTQDNDIPSIMKYNKVGDTLQVKILRKGTKKTIPVKLRTGM